MHIDIEAHTASFSETSDKMQTLYNWLTRLDPRQMSENEFDISVHIKTRKKKDDGEPIQQVLPHPA